MSLVLANALSDCCQTWTGARRRTWYVLPSGSRWQSSSTTRERGASDQNARLPSERGEIVSVGPATLRHPPPFPPSRLRASPPVISVVNSVFGRSNTNWLLARNKRCGRHSERGGKLCIRISKDILNNFEKSKFSNKHMDTFAIP